MFLANGEYKCDGRISGNYNGGQPICGPAANQRMDVPFFRADLMEVKQETVYNATEKQWLGEMKSKTKSG
jgi:hypothetical protein